jgi:integrase
MLDRPRDLAARMSGMQQEIFTLPIDAARVKAREILRQSPQGGYTPTLTGDSRAVLTVRGKTGERETVCNIGVDRFLAELKAFRTTELGRIPSGDEHLFSGRNGAPIGSFKVGFNRVLKEAGVLFGSDGKRRVPYSLRHTYATMRISEGGKRLPAGGQHGHISRDD